MIERIQKLLLIAFALNLYSCGSDDPSTGSDERSLYKVSTLTESFKGSGGLAVDANGFIYVADFGDQLSGANGTIVSRVDPNTGEVTEFADSLDGPSGNTFAENGNLIQANIAGNFISEITPEGEVSRYPASGLSSPVGVAFDSNGNLFVCNCAGSTIQKITPEGQSTRFVSGNILLNCPNGLAIDDNDNLYVANFYNGGVIKISPEGEAELFADLPGRSNAHIAFRNDQLYVLSRAGNQLYKLGLDGKLTLIAGTGKAGNEDGSGNEATFHIPNGIDVSPDGKRIYVVSRKLGGGNPLNPVFVRVIELK